jgi:hypothetical protein
MTMMTPSLRRQRSQIRILPGAPAFLGFCPKRPCNLSQFNAGTCVNKTGPLVQFSYMGESA